MSKKRDKNTKDGKDKKDNTHKKNNKHGKHCKSKKADGQKWKRPAGYSKEYEARRNDEGHITKLKIKALVTLLYGIYSPVTASEKRMIAYMVCLADREFRCHSYRQHVSYLQTCPGSLHMYGLKTVPSKSCLHHAAAIMADYEWLHEIIERQTESHARESLLGDATGFAIIRYAEWEDAKRGIVSRREFVKLHIVTDVKGRKIVSCAVTPGRTHDSPVFREMIKKVPNGSGSVMLDAGYDAHENYNMICDTGRKPVICTRKNHVVKGFGPRAEMLRWQEKNPEEFDKTYHQRSIVESVFSSLKSRFTAVVRAKKTATQRLQLIFRCICYNLLS